ncbi:accessory gene regulator ArgB-like protein [Clostridium weizhouense]|uniref:Accessory gene regulator B family protein n=1 Tax=Clostridium weizhouense TaxID=2859781 RepID=A0ABS7AJ17_9CLOT|nr:accessory gene regulator B family protein [Clostridium weizhouense]MBW6408659.1 accessory gene regulator B family protein [Clostridium weizhouense]
MIRQLIKNSVKNVSDYNGYTKEQCEQMQYIATLLFFELIKLISIILIFSVLGYFKESIIIIVVMSFTKPFIGGYHEETQIKCLIASLLITTGVIELSLHSKLSFVSNCILIAISLFCIWNTAPVINSKMPITRPSIIKKNRLLGITISIMFGIISIGLYHYSDLYEFITWTILFQAMLMFNKKGV